MRMNPNTRTRYMLVATAFLVLGISYTACASLRGAAGILKELQGEPKQAVGARDKAPDDFSARLEAYAERRTSLDPDQAAREWMSLYDQLDAVPVASRTRAMFSSFNVSQESEFAGLVDALPAPDAWPELARLIRERPEKKGVAGARELALRVLGSTLNREYDAARKEIEQLTELVQLLPSRQRQSLTRSMEGVSGAVNAVTGDADRLVRALVETMRKQESDPRDRMLDIPDLVTLIGKEQARPIIDRALRLPRAMVRVPLGDATLNLAQERALEAIEELKHPQWSLVASLDAVPLYEALSARFDAASAPPAKVVKPSDSARVITIGDDYDGAMDIDFARFLPADHEIIISANVERERRRADLYYVFGLIAANRASEAAAAARSLGEQQSDARSIPQAALHQLERAGYLTGVYEFMLAMLEQNPELHYWDELVVLGAKANSPDSTRDFVLRTLQRDDLSEDLTHRLAVITYRAQLAADEVDDAIVRMRDLLEWSARIDREEVKKLLPTGRMALALQLARVGHWTGRDDLREYGLTVAHEEWANEMNSAEYGHFYQSQDLFSVLLDWGRYDEAESLLTDQLKRIAKRESGDGYSFVSGAAQQVLVALAELYVLADRPGDVLFLLEEFPQWGVKDLAECFTLKAPSMPLGYSAAVALHRAGRDDQAIRLLEAVLNAEGGYDPAYELYVSIRGADAIPFLDELFQRDQFEERPLIWKAHVLRSTGRLDEAKAAAAKAISIDPSDGEQGRGHRMRVYAEMGEIERALGNEEQAEFFADIIRSIRLAEDADLVYESGLLRRGIRMYHDALDFFTDAYCIQSRMAVQLEQAGDYRAAEAHYLKAYELMPDSFGRVESHCFGCEGVFDSPRAQGVAERVFTELYREMPDKPQVPYLLGYLRYAQRAYDESVELFRAALALDPDYLSAWNKLGDVGQRIQLQARDRDAVTLNQIRLDPNHRRIQPRYAEVYDLAALWNAVDHASQWWVTSPSELYPLAASARELANREGRAYFTTYRSYGRYGKPAGPAQAVARQSVIQAVIEFMKAARRS